MSNYREKFDNFLSRAVEPDQMIGTTDITPTDIPQSGDTVAWQAATGDKVLPFESTQMDVLKTNQDMQSGDFVSGSTGWKIWGNGDVEFNNGTFRGALTASTIDIGGSDTTSFHVDIDGNLWLGGATFATATFTVSNAGAIGATSGLIAGWNLVSGYIYSLTSGTPTSSPSGGIVMASTNPAITTYEGTDKRTVMGYLSAGVFGFRGYATDGTTTIFELSNTLQQIAGWSFTNTTISSTGVSIISGTSASIAFGVTVPTSPTVGTGIYIDKTGLFGLSANTQNFKISATDGSITSISGTIGAWNITSTVLRSGASDAASNIFLSPGTSLIRLGPTTGDYLSLDGANLRIRSSNYVSGFAGAGFTLEPGLLEVGNIAARGLIRSSVMEYNNISVHSGSDLIAQGGDVLAADMTAADASTFTIKGTDTFAVNDRLRIKDGTNDEWLLVTGVGSAPTYSVTRDQAGAYGANSNPAWKKGASVTNYGQSGAGLIYMTASDTNAPYLSVLTHAGSPWTTVTTQLRLGNLNGYLGYVADTFGLGVGSSSGTNANITIDPTNGIRIRNGTTNIITLDNSGNVTVNTITATSGTIGAFTIGATSISSTGLALTSGSSASLAFGTTVPTSPTAGTGIYMDKTGLFGLSANTQNFKIDATNGNITSIAGTIAAFTIAGTTLSATNLTLTSGAANTANITVGTGANAGGLNSANGASDIVFWAGGTFANRATAPFRVTAAGDLIATSATLSGYVVSSKGAFGGDGSDGALAISSGTTTIDLGNEALVVKNYTSISITGTGGLAFTNPHTNGTTIILKSQGDVTLTSSTAPMIDASALGASGGAATASSGGANIDGQAGSDGKGVLIKTGGGLGGNMNSAATNAGGSTSVAVASIYTKYFQISPGGGGGGGGYSGGSGGGSGAGGRGGGGLIIECGGAWNFTTASGISVKGANGGNSTAGAGSRLYQGGSGGGSGSFLCLYSTLTANSGTVTVSATTGGTGEESGTGQANVGPSGGASVLGSGTNGTAVGDTVGAPGVGGAAGISIIQQNTSSA